MRKRNVVHREAVNLDGETVQFDLVRMVRRRHAHLVVNAQGRLELRAPYRCSTEWARGILQDNAGWVRERLARALNEQPMVLKDGCVLRFDGRTLRLRVRYVAQRALFDDTAPSVRTNITAGHDHRSFAAKRKACRPAQESARAPIRMHLNGQVGFELDGLTLTAYLQTLRGEVDLPAALELWYRLEAQVRLGPRLQRFAGLLHREPSKITIRGQTTRWGSCSSRGAISLNWKLLLLDSALADYVLAHEACHLIELNHSAHFWALLHTLLPDYKQRQKALARVPANLGIAAQSDD